jgi:phenylacetate-CoA ligase
MHGYLDLLPRSAVPGIAWPAIPGSKPQLLMTLLLQLEQSQWWPLEKLREQQLRQLRELVGHAIKNPLYRDRLQQAGIEDAADLDWAGFRRIPLLTRPQLQEAGEGLFCPTPPSHGEPRVTRTSGSTGRPVATLENTATRLFWTAFMMREDFWQRRDLTLPAAAIRFFRGDRAMPPEGQRVDPSDPMINQVTPVGAALYLNIRTDVEKQLEWLQRQDPAYLLTHPTNLDALAELAIERGVTLGGLRETRTLSETLTPRTRALVQEAWGVPVTDMYTTREAGYLALQCPGHEHYHVQAESAVVELLRDDGSECAPGETGRLVVTPLHNFSSPLLRYDIGDYAVAGAPCDCGRGLPVLERILGRVRHMLVHPDGRKTWPLLNYNAYREILPIRQIQMRQTAADSIEVLMVSDRRASPEESRQLHRALQESLEFPHTFNLQYTDRIERSSSGKYEEFISELHPA